MTGDGTLTQGIDRLRQVYRAEYRAETLDLKWLNYEPGELRKELYEYCERQQERLLQSPEKRGAIEIPVSVPEEIPTYQVACLKWIDPADPVKLLFQALVQDQATGLLYQVASQAKWPEYFDGQTGADFEGVWIRRTGEIGLTCANTTLRVDGVDVGNAALRPASLDDINIRTDLENLSIQARSLFHDDIVQRSGWHLRNFSMPVECPALYEEFLTDRLLQDGAIIPTIRDTANVKTWDVDIEVQTRCREDDVSIRDCLRSIAKRQHRRGDSESGRTITHHVDDVVKEVRKRREKRGGRDRDPTHPALRSTQAFLLLEIAVRDAVRWALQIAPQSEVAGQAEAIRLGTILALDRTIADLAAQQESTGLAVEKELGTAITRRDQLSGKCREQILARLIVEEGLSENILGMSPAEAQVALEHRLLQ